MAANVVPTGKLTVGRLLIEATLLPAHASRREGAAGGRNRFSRTRNTSPARPQFRTVRESGKQHDAVGMRWTLEERERFGKFHDLTGIDDSDARAKMRGNRNIARDE